MQLLDTIHVSYELIVLCTAVCNPFSQIVLTQGFGLLAEHVMKEFQILYRVLQLLKVYSLL